MKNFLYTWISILIFILSPKLCLALDINKIIKNWDSIKASEGEIREKELNEKKRKQLENQLSKINQDDAARIYAEILLLLLSPATQTELSQINRLETRINNNILPRFKDYLLFAKLNKQLQLGETIQAYETSLKIDKKNLEDSFLNERFLTLSRNLFRKAIKSSNQNSDSHFTILEKELNKLLLESKNKSAYRLISTQKISPINTQKKLQLLKIKDRIYKNLKKSKERINFLKKAVLSAPEHFKLEITKILAMSYWSENMPKKAKAEIEKIKQRDNYYNYVLGRLNEDIDLLDQAKNIYSNLCSSKIADKYSILACQRLINISLKNKRKDFDKYKNLYEKQINNLNQQDKIESKLYLEFWSKNHTKKIDLITEIGPISTYYFLENKNLLKDIANILKQKSNDSCKLEKKPIQLKQLKEKLEQEGLDEFFGVEFNHIFKSSTNNINETYQNALTASFLDLNQKAIEFVEKIRSTELAKRCKKEIILLRYPTPYLDLYSKYGEKYKIPLSLSLAISRTESLFNPNALSWVGAKGLMQLMPQTAKLEGLKKNQDLLNPSTNIEFGTKHLARLLDEFSNQQPDFMKNICIAASYNAGKEATERWIKENEKMIPELFIEFISYAETRDYVKKVIGAQKIYQLILQNR